MLLWVIFAAITAAVVLAVTRPLARDPAPLRDAAEADLAVYRDQLAEIDADRDRGLVDADEAQAARAEVARRLLHRAGDEKSAAGAAGAAGSGSARRFSLVASAFIAVASILLYLMLGSPGLPDLPHAARVAKGPAGSSLPELVAQVEARLRAKPDDGQGWDVVAPVYMIQKRYADAAEAYGRAISLLGETPKRLGGLAEASVLAGNGIVSDRARKAYERLLVLEPTRVEARFWLAMAMEQDGKLAEATAAYRDMLAQAPEGATWKSAVEERLKEIAERSGAPSAPAPAAPAKVAAPPADAPSSKPDASAVAAMDPAEREAFIGRMVSGLAERLKANGKDLEGWQRLVRAYKVLGKTDAAAAALADARRNFDGDAKAQAELDAFARSLGLGS